MCELYNRRIVHCDLKPGNILISKRGHLAIADFGISLVADSREDDEKEFEECIFHAYGGTYAYQAPEMLISRGASDFTCAVDMWSLGVIIYEMYTGKVRPLAILAATSLELTGPTPLLRDMMRSATLLCR